MEWHLVNLLLEVTTYHVQRGNMTKARDLADIVSNLSANAEKAVVVNAGGTELTFGDAGSSDLYGFVKTNGTGTQKED